MDNIRIVSASPEDADFIAWIVAQGMHMDDVPPFLEGIGARDDTLYSWTHTRLLQCEGKPIGGLISYDGATHEEGRRKTWVMPDGNYSTRATHLRQRKGNTILTPWLSYRSFEDMACGNCCLMMPLQWPGAKDSIE